MPGVGRLAVLAPAEPPDRGVLLPRRLSTLLPRLLPGLLCGLLCGLLPGLLSGRPWPGLIDIIGVAV